MLSQLVPANKCHIMHNILKTYSTSRCQSMRPLAAGSNLSTASASTLLVCMKLEVSLYTTVVWLPCDAPRSYPLTVSHREGPRHVHRELRSGTARGSPGVVEPPGANGARDGTTEASGSGMHFKAVQRVSTSDICFLVVNVAF